MHDEGIRDDAMPKAIERAGITPQDIDVYEIHEAFAAQVLAVLREFKTHTGYEISDERLNPNGAAVALGHPFGDSGARRRTRHAPASLRPDRGLAPGGRSCSSLGIDARQP